MEQNGSALDLYCVTTFRVTRHDVSAGGELGVVVEAGVVLRVVTDDELKTEMNDEVRIVPLKQTNNKQTSDKYLLRRFRRCMITNLFGL